MLIYGGPSMLNGKPIVGILTFGSSNRKTGAMAQLFILPRRVNPVKASYTGYDQAVCGDCPLRHCVGGACYVNIGHSPTNVWNAFKRGKYPDNTALRYHKSFRLMRLRLGSYGDPAALPFEVVQKLAKMFGRYTGYTHQWKSCDRRFQKLIMASTETLADRAKAKAKGWRTFRIVESYGEMQDGERICANSSHDVKCIDCIACHGKTGRADIVVKVHGPWGRRLKVAVG